MCRAFIEKYNPPDKTKSPRSIEPQLINELKDRKARYVPDPFIKSAVDLVSADHIKNNVIKLCSYHNRHSKSSNIHDVAKWIYDELANRGYDDIQFHKYSQEGHELENVICSKNGYNHNNDEILLCAHFDTILQNDTEDIESRAPGANDNASGVASLLEIARLVSSIDLEKTIRFAFFSGEEQGLWGSTHYAESIKNNGINLHVLVNMDMCGETGYLPSTLTSYIDIDNGQTGILDSNNELSKSFGIKMEAIADTYTQIDTVFDPIDASDYMPFEARGYVCIGAYDGSAVSSNSHYHDESDVIENLDFNFLLEVTKMVLGFVIDEGITKRIRTNN